MWLFVGLVIGGYGAWLLLLYLLQDRMFFPGTALPATATDPPGGVERLWVTHPDGPRTEVWVAIPADAARPVPWVLYLHGNYELIDGQDHVVELLRSAGWAVVLPEYRGYGSSEGEPSQAVVTDDLVRVVDRMRQAPNLDSDRVVFWGRSLGAGFAAQVARHRPPAGLIVQTPFLRTDRMALRYLAPPWLVRHPFRSDRVVRRLDRPLLILEHAHDEVAPPGHAAALHRLARRSHRVVLQTGHNGPVSPSEVRRADEAVLEFLADVNEAAIDPG
ncbi:MAG: alpha/beta hydrolase [Myxococcota bacterium]